MLCLFYKKSCLCFWDRPFLFLFDVFPCKLNLEICLFRPLPEAETGVPRGLGWGKGKEGLFLKSGFFCFGSFEHEEPSAIKGRPEQQ
jgi:hypothetical protein